MSGPAAGCLTPGDRADSTTAGGGTVPLDNNWPLFCITYTFMMRCTMLAASVDSVAAQGGGGGGSGILVLAAVGVRAASLPCPWVSHACGARLTYA